jgi:hypothetical protein
MLKMMIRLFAFIFILTACSYYRTADTSVSGNRSPGVLYFLPKGLIRIVIQDTPATPAASTATATTNASKATPTPSQGGTDSSTSAASGSFTTRVIQVSGILVPDKNFGPYFLHYAPNALTDDTVDITVNGSQLLQTANAVSVDQTATGTL